MIIDSNKYRKCILLIVCIVLFLDNMVYMVIVPIIPTLIIRSDNKSTNINYPIDNNSTHEINEGDEKRITLIFSIKAIIQLFISPISGHLIDHFGTTLSLVTGLSLLSISTALFAFTQKFGWLVTARCFQGIGSAFATTSGFTIITETFLNLDERRRALGISLAFISFGTLAAPPFGGILYQLFGARLPFLVLSLISLGDLTAYLALKRVEVAKEETKKLHRQRTYIEATPIWKLFLDPLIAICAGGLSVANISLAFIEPTIGIWMIEHMNAQSWQIGFVWFPAILPHWIGVYLTVWIMQNRIYHHWQIASAGLAIEAIMCVIVPLCNNFWVLIVPLCGICFGNAVIDTALMPMVAHLTDTRHTSVYGSSYAIVDISYTLAYAFGPVFAGSIMSTIGFTYMNMLIFCITLAYVPVLKRLREIDVIYEEATTDNLDYQGLLDSSENI